MPVEDSIVAVARELAAQAQQRIPHFERQKLHLQKELADVQLSLDAANLAVDRLANFPVTLGRDWACPRCWISTGRLAVLIDVPSDTVDDVLHCRECHLDVLV